jgi:hypothetical protein
MKRKDCDCIDRALPLLAAKNTRLVVALSLSGECDKAVLSTECVRKTRGRDRPVTVVATYCPFCGKKYPVKAKSVTEGVLR